MLDFSASAFADLFSALMETRKVAEEPDFAATQLTWHMVTKGRFAKLFRTIEETCSQLNLPVTLEARKRIVDNINFYNGQKFADDLGNLQKTAIDELKSKVFLFVANGDVNYFSGRTLFGADVYIKFPQTALDLAEAGKCFALDRNTAAVFHLMRVLEAGVKAFASNIGVTVGPKDTWGVILSNINTAINILPQTTQQEKEYYQTCHGLYSGLDAIRIAWRNPTMHEIAVSYQKDEARDIFEMSRIFMCMLVKII